MKNRNTAREQQADRLAEPHQRAAELETCYRSVVESARDIIFTISRDNIVTFLNPAFERITGWPRMQWLDKNYESLIHPDDLSFLMEMYQCVLNGELPPGFESRILSRSGEYVTMELLITPQLHHGEVIGILNIGRNITERRQVLEKTIESAGTGGTAHELNNILTPIILSVQILKEKFKDEESQRLLGILERNANRGADLVKQIRSFARGRADKVYLSSIAITEMQKSEGHFEPPEGRGESILIVDDETPIREITSATLKTSGYRVLTASDGAEASTLYAQNREDIMVVLMDMAMPVMEGPECIRILHKVNPAVKIIAVSGSTDTSELEDIADYVHAFLPKPYTAQRLLHTIHEVINR
ncbi:PAS domain S-box [Candidatus Methanoperedens nitroreducens]|uniref:PAS domain S-box n=1 Tax=Candidatus Methanoperedens nitratireducens TaxID=1392998 RepID=A0A062V457_9EURY|nr:PAS domain S-box protein [Candidatus Methanoperedens nitroreducens]KCZ72127.1 PAS domain S-box [Candidatus Methanoperedens nitroreducens]MDJ1421896.1 PAS domain S-box protein [Candidatus Methanoperedens sp.]